MKRRFTILTAAFTLLAILAIPMGMKGQTASFAPADFSGQGTSGTGSEISATVDGVTFACDKGYGTTQIRCYSGGVITISSSNTITAISFTFSGTYTGGMETSYTSLSTTSWTKTLSSQARITACSVSYAGGDTPQPTTYTVTFDAGDGTFVGNTDFPNASNTVATGTYTLPSATPAEGYVFNGWALGENTYEGGASYTVSGNADFVASYTENTTPTPEGETATLNIQAYAQANSWTNGTKYTTATVAPVTFTANGGGNTGKYYESGHDWRFYQGESASITITVPEGYTLVSVTPTYSVSNSGVLKNGNATIASGTTVNVSGTSVTFTVGNSGAATNGQVRFTNIDVVYVSNGGVLPPSISANNVEIAFDAIAGSFEFTVNNPVEGGVTTVTEDVDWISDAVVSGNTVNFSTSANESSTARTATITLTYTYGDNETVTKEVTITQAAAPVIYTTIPTLFEAATSTETSVLVTFNNWVVSGVSTNGKNVFVTDNSGNGFVIYSNEDMSSIYAAGSILSGTAVSCSLKKYNGFAELLNVNATDLTIATGGNVTEANVAMADLAGVNTSALVHYENLTCSVNNNKYYLTDGTTTIQVYNLLFAFDALEDGETYNITGIYQQYNNTKEILPRSAADIEEVEVPHSECTLTVEPFENLELITFVNDEMVMEGDGEIQVNEGDQIMLSIVVAEGYVMQTLMVNGVNHVNDIADDFTYSFEMPAENVTISATAVENVPPTLGAWVLTNLADITENDVFVIVGDNGNTYAMSNEKGTSAAPAAVAVTVAEGTLSAEPAANLQWNIRITDDGYIFYPNGTTETWLYCTNTNNGVRVGDNENNVFTLSEEGYLFNNATSRYIGIYNSQDWRCYTSINNNIIGQTFAFYKKVAEPATETHTLTINGYQNDENEGGYALIASPVNVDPATVGMTTGDFDLYYFDESQELEWRNYEATPFNLVPGTGYLYAKKATTEGETFSFELTGTPYSGNGTVDLTYTENAEFAGFNLIGNPFGTNAILDLPYYRLNSDGSALNTTTESSEINVMEGVFVQATAANQKANFTKVGESAKKIGQLNVKVTRNRSVILDNAIIRFDEGATLSKFQLNANSTKLYFTEGNQDFAVVRSANEGEMPVNFKAGENGTYTISINAEGVSFTYLHLIDNMTGADVDLLATPSYSFEAKVTDYTNRFRLVFNANSSVNEQNSETFAFFNGSNLVISNKGEATLQVIDMMGRMISSEQIQGSYNNSLNLSAGVYVLRLSNGNAVKTQKIVID